MDPSNTLTQPEPPERAGADATRAGEGGTRVGEALEASVEGVAGSLSLSPSGGAPSLGGELLLTSEPPGPHGATATAVVSPATVRSGMLEAGPLALAGLAANGANALVTVLVARLLTNRGYGSLAQLTGLFLVVSMPGAAVIVGVVRRITTWADGASTSAVRRWAVRLHARGTVALGAFSVAVVFLRGQIDRFLSSPNSAGVAAMLVAGGIWVLLSFDRGLLQARREYRTLAINLLVEGVGRVVGILCLVGAGLGVAGAAGGVLLAELVTALHARIAADRAWSEPAPWEPGHGEAAGRAGRQILRPLLRDILHRQVEARPRQRLVQWWRDVRSPAPEIGGAGDRWTIVADLAVALPSLALIALLQNIDVIVLARDDPHSSGVYAAISVVSKALVFGAVALGGYLLPEAAIHWHRGHHALRQLTVTIVLLGVPAVALLVVAALAPHTLLTLVFTARYAGASNALAMLVLAMMCLSLTVTLTMYLLAVGCRWIVGVLAAGSVAAVAALAAAHGAPRPTAANDLVVQAAVAAATTIGFVIVHRRRLPQRLRRRTS